MKKIKLLLWSAVVATLSACSSSSPEALEGSWQLTHIDGKPAATGAVLQLNLKDKKGHWVCSSITPTFTVACPPTKPRKSQV